MSTGAFPWWTLPTLRLSFLRQLTVATHLLDEALWPRSPWLMHAQSLLWYALLELCAARLYRCLFALPDPDTGDAAQAQPWPAWAAGLATVLYAVDDAHGVPAAWLAHRNEVVAATFALLTLAAAAQRTPLLLAGQLGRPPPDLATFLPATTAPMLALALLLLLGVALALRPLWRHLARRLRGGRCERPSLPP